MRRAMSRPNPAPIADVLGGEKGFERTGPDVQRHAGAVVGHLDDDRVSLDPTGQHERSASGHGVDGVVDEACPQCVELGRVSVYERHVGPERAEHVYPFERRTEGCQRRFDAGMDVDVASPAGGMIPVEPLSVNSIIRTAADDRLLADHVLRAKITDSLPVTSVDINAYDIVYLAGGWGAAFDLGFSEVLGAKITDANAAGKIIGGVCHGPLGLINATATDGRPLVEGRRVTGVSNRQVRDLRITDTPQHPETELRRKGALYESSTRITDILANHWVVDGNLVTGQNQNAGPMVAREMLRLAQAAHGGP